MVEAYVNRAYCAVCNRLYTKRRLYMFFDTYSKYCILFNDKPYYLCSPSCKAKFYLTPILYKPVSYEGELRPL